MKRQSETEWLAELLSDLHIKWLLASNDHKWHRFTARRLLIALKRRGWTPPKPTKKGRGK